LAQQAAALRAQIDPMYARSRNSIRRWTLPINCCKESSSSTNMQVQFLSRAVQDHAKAVAGSGNSLDQASGKSKQAAAGYINLGRQMQDVAVMAAMPGVNLGTIITTQGGQIADAVSQMGGKFSGLASFLAGPWARRSLSAPACWSTLPSKCGRAAMLPTRRRMPMRRWPTS
jgi:hypothetical protein